MKTFDIKKYIEELDLILKVTPRTKRLKIWFDADGVLVDWENYVSKRLITISDMFSPTDNYSNIAILNKIPSEERTSLMNGYYKLYPDTFRHLDMTPALPFFKEVIKLLVNHNIAVGILSAIGMDHPEYSVVTNDKHFNLKRHLGGLYEFIDIRLVYDSSSKQLFSSPNNLLIDDFKRNCAEFKLSGGLAIHHSCPIKTLIKLRTHLI